MSANVRRRGSQAVLQGRVLVRQQEEEQQQRERGQQEQLMVWKERQGRQRLLKEQERRAGRAQRGCPVDRKKRPESARLS